MKIEARVEFLQSVNGCEEGDVTYVNVDADYVEDNVDSVTEWVRNELEKKLNGPFSNEDFCITNMDAILEDIAFDEFQDKTQYADV